MTNDSVTLRQPNDSGVALRCVGFGALTTQCERQWRDRGAHRSLAG
jgi:hypothetical protein